MRGPVCPLCEAMTRTRRVRAGLAVCVACLVGCDHASKLAAQAALRNRASVPIVRGIVDLSYAENRDIAFNALSRLSLYVPAWTLTAFAVVATVAVLAAWGRRRRATWSEHAGFALVCAGAIGNWLDRLMRGHVIDFIHVRSWPVFNVADVLVVLGVALLMLRGGLTGTGETVPPGAATRRASGGAATTNTRGAEPHQALNGPDVFALRTASRSQRGAHT
jgi:signal peptidase II